jgi:ubiquinone/menaquinone biosynthesis C-methylase UbiE
LTDEPYSATLLDSAPKDIKCFLRSALDKPKIKRKLYMQIRNAEGSFFSSAQLAGGATVGEPADLRQRAGHGQVAGEDAATEAAGFHDQSRWDEKAGDLRFQARHHAIVATAAPRPGMSVLDVASGRGEVAVLAAKAGAVVTATDIGSALINAIRRNAQANGVEVDARPGDMRALPFPDGSFDCVLGAAALHHLDPQGAREAVHEAVRVLRPGGRALFLEPIENAPVFDFIKHVVPGPKGRPSILQRSAWKQWLQERDDRAMSDAELLAAHPSGRIVARLGMVVRIKRNPQIESFDAWLLRTAPFLGRYAQTATVEYRR